MKLLLDTHIWIWSVNEPQRLSSRVTRALTDRQNELWLSSISVWELVMLTRKGRVELDDDTVAWTRRAVEQLQLQEAPVTTEVALETSSLNLPHSEPADRLIAASAKIFDLTLVTADRKLIETPGLKILANR